MEHTDDNSSKYMSYTTTSETQILRESQQVADDVLVSSQQAHFSERVSIAWLTVREMMTGALVCQPASPAQLAELARAAGQQSLLHSATMIVARHLFHKYVIMR